MNAIIPYQNLNSRQKKIIIEANQKLYRNSSKKDKIIMLNEIEDITGYSRKYIIYLLNIHNKVIRRRGRKRVYNEKVSLYTRFVE